MLDRLFILFQYLLPKKTLSRAVGYLARSEVVWLKNMLIRLFVRRYRVDLSEAEYTHIKHYDSFNHFFTRRLIDGARNTDPSPTNIASPCDGVISQFGHIEYQQLIQAKGQHYTLMQLLANDQQLSDTFNHGAFVTCYLSPKDYHRVHMPMDGQLIKTIYVPGQLFSVNQTTATHIPRLYARNERLICEFKTAIGPVLIILVGATIVAGIETSWAGQVAPPPTGIRTQHFTQDTQVSLNKGDELGLFKLGSTVIMLFTQSSIEFNAELKLDQSICMGDTFAQTQDQLNNEASSVNASLT